MYKEYELVKATKDINKNVPCGTLGTVLMIYNVKPKEYEVEFVDLNGNSLDVITVNEKDIEKYKEN